MIWFIFAAFLLVPALLQWMILCWTETRFRILRWVLLALPALLAWRGWWRLTAPFEEYPHHEGLAGVLLCMFAGLSLLGWALGWVLYEAEQRRK